MHVGIVDLLNIIRILALTNPIKDLLVVYWLKLNSIPLRKKKESEKSKY